VTSLASLTILFLLTVIRLTVQVMKNAIKNAIQYMSPGYFQLKVYYIIYDLLMALIWNLQYFAIFLN
jgi:hypothetical protein